MFFVSMPADRQSAVFVVDLRYIKRIMGYTKKTNIHFHLHAAAFMCHAGSKTES